MKAMDRRMIAAAVTPLSRRRPASAASEPANAAAPAVTADSRQASATTRYLPKRSPTGPQNSWQAVGEREGGDGETDGTRGRAVLARDRGHQGSTARTAPSVAAETKAARER
jgi:hypothetical protein